MKTTTPIEHARWLRLLSISGVFLIGWLGLALSDLNTPLFIALHKHLQSGLPESVWQNLSLTGDALWVIAAFSLLLARHERMVLSAAIAGGLTAIVVQFLKHWLAIDRPPAVLDEASIHVLGEALSKGSFPSGHTATVFVIAAILIAHIQKPLWVTIIWVWACMSALSRIAVGVHWPEDLLMGACIGWFFGIMILKIEPKLGKMHYPKRWCIFALTYLSSIGLLVHDSGLESVEWVQYSTAFIGLWLSAAYCSRRVLRIREDVHA